MNLFSNIFDQFTGQKEAQLPSFGTPQAPRTNSYVAPNVAFGQPVQQFGGGATMQQKPINTSLPMGIAEPILPLEQAQSVQQEDILRKFLDDATIDATKKRSALQAMNDNPQDEQKIRDHIQQNYYSSKSAKRIAEGEDLGVIGNIYEGAIGAFRAGEQIPRIAGAGMDFLTQNVTGPLVAGGLDLVGADQLANRWRDAAKITGEGYKKIGSDITMAGMTDGGINPLTQKQIEARKFGGELALTAPIGGEFLAGSKGLLGLAGRSGVVGAGFGAAQPIADKGAEATMSDIGYGGLAGGVTGAIAGPVLSKLVAPSIGGIASKTGKYGTALYKGGIEGAKKSIARDISAIKAPGTETITRNIPKAIVRRDLGFTPTERKNIEKITGLDEGTYILSKGLAGKGKEELAEVFMKQSDDMYNGITRELAKAEGRVQSPVAKEALLDILDQLESSPKIARAYAKDIEGVKAMLAREDFSLSELNNIRRAYDKVNTGMFTVQGKARSGLENAIDVKVRQELSNQLQNEAKKYGLDVKAMNTELRAGLEMKDALLRRLSQEEKNNFIGLQDLGVSAILSGGEPVSAVATIVAKKYAEKVAPGLAQKAFNLNKTPNVTRTVSRGNTIVNRNKSSGLGLGNSTDNTVVSSKLKNDELELKSLEKALTQGDDYAKAKARQEYTRKLEQIKTNFINSKYERDYRAGLLTKTEQSESQYGNDLVKAFNELKTLNSKHSKGGIDLIEKNSGNSVIRKRFTDAAQAYANKMSEGMPTQFTVEDVYKMMDNGQVHKVYNPRVIKKPTPNTIKNESKVSNTQSSDTIPEGYFKNALGEIVKKPSNKKGGFIRNPFAKPEPKRLFAGENSAQPPKGKTGWFKGADGKMRFEIDDSVAQVLKSEIKQSEMPAFSQYKTKLKDVLGHSELFKQYPELKEMDVYFDGDLRNNGFYSDGRGLGKKGITLKADFVQGKEIPGSKGWKNEEGTYKLHSEAKSTILHELQHAIQEKEGFAKGGNLSTVSGLGKSEQDQIARVEKEIRDAITKKNSGDWVYESSTLDEIINSGNAPSEIKQWAKSVAKSGEKGINEFLDSTPFAQYQKLSGEVEARNVQARMGLTAKERTIKKPESTEDVPRAKQIIRMDSKGPSMSIPEIGKKVEPTENIVPTGFSGIKNNNSFKINTNKLTSLADGDEAFYVLNQKVLRDKIIKGEYDPIIVIKGENGTYDVMDGTHRLATAKDLGIKEVKIIEYPESKRKEIMDKIREIQRKEKRLPVENQSKSIVNNPLVEEARKYKSAEEFVDGVKKQSDRLNSTSSIGNDKFPEVYNKTKGSPKNAPKSDDDFLSDDFNLYKTNSSDSKILEEHPYFGGDYKSLVNKNGEIFLYIKPGKDFNKLSLGTKYEMYKKGGFITENGGKTWDKINAIDEVDWSTINKYSKEELQKIYNQSKSIPVKNPLNKPEAIRK